MRMKLILPLLFLALMFLPLALAEQTEQTTEECRLVPGANLPPVTGSDIPLRQVTYTDTIALPKFDPGLGLLTKVYLTVDACGKQDFAIDNEDPGEGPFNFELTHTGLIRVTVPLTIPEIVDVVVTETTSVTLPTDSDGLPDFVGDDSYSSTIEKCSDAPLDKEYTLPSDLAVFTASSPGSTESVNLPVRASGNMEIATDSGNAASLFSTFMGAKACVVYEYQTFCINGSKINDCTELGLPGWTINLEDASGAVIATATTDATGKYSFCNLVPGTYTVCETPQAGWIPVGETCTEVNVVDADVADVNFRNTPLLCIEGSKTNGLTGEGLSGWTINLLDENGNQIATTTTDASGNYQFCDLLPGDYTVCEVMQANWKNTGDICIQVTLDCENEVDVNFENIPSQFCINGTKTDACTGEGLPGWEICLTDSEGNKVCTTTDANGDYSFCGLDPGDYEVCETPQAGWKPVEPTCITVTLVDESADGVDFENEPPFCISGHKYNGTTGEEGLAGWTINLKDASGNQIATTTTSADGSYQFCDLFSGTYTVCEVMKSGWTAITPTCIPVTLDCAPSEDNDFRNKPTSPPPCGPGCPWFIKNELYTANCKEIKEVGADKGILANEMFDDVVVVNPESITIDPKYGTIEVFEDGSFVYNPIGATGIRNGVYVQFKYTANNGLCDAKYQGIAKIQVACK